MVDSQRRLMDFSMMFSCGMMDRDLVVNRNSFMMLYGYCMLNRWYLGNLFMFWRSLVMLGGGSVMVSSTSCCLGVWLLL